MKKFIMILFIGLGVLSVTGCNTMQGLGQDVSKGGQALSASADNVKSQM